MKIESIQITQESTIPLGIKPIKLSKLGRVVLVAGKNGSGKSRFLKLLESHTNSIISIKENEFQIESRVQSRKSDIKSWEEYIITLLNQVSATADLQHKANLEAQINHHKINIDRYNNEIIKDYKTKKLLYENVIIGRSNVLKYVPTNLSLTDSNTLNPNQILEFANYASTPSMDRISQATLAKIQSVQTRWFYATHQAVDAPIENREQAIKDYERLKEYIRLFLGAELGIDLNGGLATLFDKHLGQVNFSQGQIVLLQFCVALYSQDTALSEMILLLDEPENHLHPAALNYVLDKLLTVVTNGQIWIATHSVNLLAHLQQETLLYMEDGAISYAGNDTMKVLEGLLGNEEEREKLSTFLSLPFIVSGTRFAYESLMGAAVVMTGAADPQIRQIRTALESSKIQSNESGKLKILDYGAGKGRLVATMHELAVAANESLESWLDYIAFDPGKENADECRNNISKSYSNSIQRHYSNLALLREEQMDDSFDLIILTNVFHEVDPKDWTTMLKDIQRLLKKTGKLIIVEDQRLPRGEQAHSYGFILFDTLEFMKLFSITNDDRINKEYEYKSEQEGRLKAHFFSKEIISNVTNATRGYALKELAENSKKEVENVRSSQATLKNGRLHAFWVQQFANASLALEKLG